MSCPFCGYSGKWVKGPHGRVCKCPTCGSLDRHRDLLPVLSAIPSQAVLHIAPEKCIAKWFSERVKKYQTMDAFREGMDWKCDISKPLPLSPGSFDTILCSHVLEHIEDDRAVLKNFNRILTMGGFLVIIVPLKDGHTDETPGLTPDEREERFGQFDHVRMYGRDDLPLVISGFGFEVQENNGIFVCRKIAEG